jgi:hypothetical protein
MKMKLLALLTLALGTAMFHSHSSPQPEAKTLTKEERERAIEYLEQTAKDFAAAINGLSDAQWSFKPSPERWSIAECAEHIAVSEEMVWNIVREKIMKSPAAPERRPEVAGKDEIVLKMIPDRSKRVQAPEAITPTGRFASREELVKRFDELRAQEISYLRETNDDLRSHFADHPFVKTLDAYQWLLLNGAHGKRHTSQIEEVKADPAYPKS